MLIFEQGICFKASLRKEPIIYKKHHSVDYLHYFVEGHISAILFDLAKFSFFFIKNYLQS